MRSSLLISAYLIASSLSENLPSNRVGLLILFVVFLLMDVADFGKSLKIDFYRG